MSWKKLFAADDVSTRKVERVLMWTLAEDDYAEVNVRAKLSCAVIIIRATSTQCFGESCRQTRLFTSVVLKRFGLQKKSVEILAERVENRQCELCIDEGGIIATQISVSLIIEIAVCRPTHQGH